MIYGYARVSTSSQKLDRQIESLKGYGCDQIFEEKQSGKDDKREVFQELLGLVKEGDTIVIHSLDRFMRSTKHLLIVIDELKEKGVGLVSINDKWLDTTSNNPFSDLLLTIFGGLAQYERQITKIRQKEGIEIAKRNGVHMGRPKKNRSFDKRYVNAYELYREGKHTIVEVCERSGISRSSFYRYLKDLEG